MFTKIEEFPMYEINEAGEIKSKYTGRILKHMTDKDGYYSVNLRKENKSYKRSVHRLLAQIFIPNPKNKPQVNHLDLDKKNNDLTNLEWATAYENTNHANYHRANKSRASGRKPVKQFTLDGVFIKEHLSIADASYSVKGHDGSISMCCKKVQSKAYGYYWEYAD